MSYKKITILYQDEKVIVLNAPYKPAFISKIKTIKTAKYNAYLKAWHCHASFGNVVEQLANECFPKNSVTVQGEKPEKQYSIEDCQEHIVIHYYESNGLKWASVFDLPYNAEAVRLIKRIPTARYCVDAGDTSDTVKKEWTVRAEHGEKLEEVIRLCFSNPIDVQHYNKEENEP